MQAQGEGVPLLNCQMDSVSNSDSVVKKNLLMGECVFLGMMIKCVHGTQNPITVYVIILLMGCLVQVLMVPCCMELWKILEVEFLYVLFFFVFMISKGREI